LETSALELAAGCGLAKEPVQIADAGFMYTRYKGMEEKI